MKNIVLVGFMGVGKSTIGSSLANLMNYKWVDTDKVIEKKLGEKIKNIFKNQGEDFFRNEEIQLVKTLEFRNNLVISTGGGLYMAEANREIFLKKDFVVFLNLPLEDVLERIGRNNNRPLALKDNLEEIKNRYNGRLPVYRKCSLEINVKNKAPFEIVREVRAAYYKWLKKGGAND